ncbi:MAG: hypothetical protein KDD40_13155, partial [Bdellovibrionales bacterium]|nr:hypothetical protein [Bdellovibrionales bacterium]
MNKLFILLLLFCHMVHAEQDIEFFDKAKSGKQKIEVSLAYDSESLTYSDTTSPSEETKYSGHLSALALDYGYGVSEDISLHTKLFYATGKIEERDQQNSAND